MNKKTMILCVALAATTSIPSVKAFFFDDSMDLDTTIMRFYDELDTLRSQMSRVFEEMAHGFRQRHFGRSFSITTPKNNVEVKEEDDKTILQITVGKDAKIYAKVRTKQPYNTEQLIIKIEEEAKKQKIIIKAKGYIISLYQRIDIIKKIKESTKKDKKKKEKAKEEKIISYGAAESSETMRLKHKIDLKNADMAYDKTEGVLKITLPAVKIEKKDKKIDIKITS